LAKAAKKLERRRQELAEAESAPYLRLCGEMILTQLHDIPRGAKQVALKNLYAEGEVIQARLRPDLTPFQTADWYFAQARKAEARLQALPPLIREAEQEIAKLQDLRGRLAGLAPEAALAEAEAALTSSGYLRPESPPRQKTSVRPKGIRILGPIDGFEIWVGTSAEGNGQLLRLAHSEDIWLHTRGVRGAHALIRTNRRPHQVSPQVLEKAAQVAAHFSPERHSRLVAVDYTLRKFVRRPRGAQPGLVRYERAKTLFVDPAGAQTLTRPERKPPQG